MSLVYLGGLSCNFKSSYVRVTDYLFCSEDKDNSCALLIDADNSVVLESFDDTTAEEVRSELAYRTVSNALLS